MPIETTQEADLEKVLGFIRPAIRRQKPYLVGGIAGPRVKLNQNESPYDLPDDVKAELVEAFRAIPFNRYPAEQPWELRRALADHVGHDEDGLLVGNGSNELAYTLGLALIAPGTPVVLPRPMFSLYEKIVETYDGALVSVPPRPDLHFDTAALVAAVRAHRPALTVVTTPNNPTGLALPLDEVEQVVQAVEGFVVVDEAYVEFSEEQSARTILDRYPNLILVRTLSKAFGLAGLRIGYLMGHPDVMRELLKARVPFMTDRLAEMTALVLLRHPELLHARAGYLKQACRELAAAVGALPGAEVLPSQANFFLFRTGVEPGTLMRRLADAGVLVRSMGGYPELRGYLRVNAGTPEENQAFMIALKEAVQPS